MLLPCPPLGRRGEKRKKKKTGSPRSDCFPRAPTVFDFDFDCAPLFFRFVRLRDTSVVEALATSSLSHRFTWPSLELSSSPSPLNSPSIPLQPFFLLCLAIPRSIHRHPGHGIHTRQTHGSESHGASGRESLPQTLSRTASCGE